MSQTNPSPLSLQPLALPARVEPTTDRYFGHAVSDPYRWMEKSEHQAELRSWLLRQSEHTLRLLHGQPQRSQLAARLKALMSSTLTVRALTEGGDALFYLKTKPGATLAALMMRTAAGEERVLFDPSTRLGPGGSHCSIDNFAPSPDGRFVAYNLSQGGNEITQVHFVETRSGRHLPDVLAPIWGEFRVSWLPDSSGVFYTQMNPQSLIDPKLDKLQHMKLRLHLLGSKAELDPWLLGTDVNQTAPFDAAEFPILHTSPASEWLVGMAVGARVELRLFFAHRAQLSGARTPWTALADYADQIRGLTLHGDVLYYVTDRGAPRGELRRLALPARSLAESVTVVPQGEGVLRHVVAGQDALYFSCMTAGIFRLFRLPYGETKPVEIALPFPGTLMLVDTPRRRSGVVFALEGWTQPCRYLAWEPGGAGPQSIGLADESPADFAGTVVHRTEVQSPDGALVPMTVLQRSEPAPYEPKPAILTAYGGYGDSLTPSFDPALLAWLEQGGIYAYAHVRGGGEKGREWHVAGQGKNKPKGVQDLLACAQHLIHRGDTTAQLLALRGVSMGGILIGGALTAGPELFAAVCIHGGIVNPLRILQMGNGANQVAELTATPDTAAGFEVLRAMDPYLHIQSGGVYPPTLLAVGLNDERVALWMTGKFAARLHAAGAGRSVMLVRADGEDGHGVIGATREQEIARIADEWTFYHLAFRAAAGRAQRERD